MPDTQQKIAKLLQQFQEETKSLNSLSGIENVPSSVAMIEIGEPVITYIFQKGTPLSFNLMVVLTAITGFSPPLAPFEEMKRDWLNWASQNNYQ